MEIYDLVDEIEELERLLNSEELEEEEREGNEAYKRVLSKIFEKKTEDLLKYIIVLESHISNSNKILEKAKISKKKNEEKLEKIKNGIVENMQRLNLKKIETDLGNITKRVNNVSCVILDENLIDDKFKVTKTTETVDKVNIIKEYKKDKAELTLEELKEKYKGIEFIEDKESIMIK